MNSLSIPDAGLGFWPLKVKDTEAQAFSAWIYVARSPQKP